jgi:hypothetical protein
MEESIMKLINKKGNASVAIVTTLVSVGAVYALTEYGVAKGVPAPFSFVLVLAALFGVFVLKIKG